MRKNHVYCIGIITILMLIISIGGLKSYRIYKNKFDKNWMVENVSSKLNVEHYSLDSEILDRKIGIIVRLPDNYSFTISNYTVVYYLHGKGGSEVSDYETIWNYLISIIEQKHLMEPILVTLNAGDSRFYGPIEKSITDELVPLIDARYRTIKSTKGRILIGYSMGGWAAIRFTVNNPELFGGACSIGGGMWLGRKDLLKSVHRNADILREKNTLFLLINGDSDIPDSYLPLEAALSDEKITHYRYILENQSHNLNKYLEQSEDYIGQFLIMINK